MYIGLIDLDIFSSHKFIPNLAIMKYSSFYKSQNHFCELVLDINDLDKYDAVVIQKRYLDSPYPDKIWSKKVLAIGGEAFSQDYSYKMPPSIAAQPIDTLIYRRYLLNFREKKEENKKRQEYFLDQVAYVEVLDRSYEDIVQQIKTQIGEKRKIVILLTEFNVANRIEDFNILVRLKNEFKVRLTVLEDQIWFDDVSRAIIARENSLFRPYYLGVVNTTKDYYYVRFDYSAAAANKLLEIKNIEKVPTIVLFIENPYDFTYNLANLLNLFGFLITNGKNFRCFSIKFGRIDKDEYTLEFVKLLERWQIENQGHTSFSTFYFTEEKGLDYEALLKYIIKYRPEVRISCQICPQQLQSKGGIWNYDKYRNKRAYSTT